MVTQRFDDKQLTVAFKEHPELQANPGFIGAPAQLAKAQPGVGMGSSERHGQSPEDRQHFRLLVRREPGQRGADAFFGYDAKHGAGWR